MNPIYRTFLRLGENGQQQAVRPDWKDDTCLEWKMESNEQFYRAELSSSFVFIGADYDLITQADFDTEFYFYMEKSTDMGLTWSNYFTGWFMLTDCTINIDDKKVTVKPAVHDRYTKILAGMDKEYDIIPLTPACTPVWLTRRPMLQIYVADEEQATCILNDMCWQQDVAESTTDRSKLIDIGNFGVLEDRIEMEFSGTPPVGLQQKFTGTFWFGESNGEWVALTNSENVYYISYYQNGFIHGLNIRRVSDDELIWNYEENTLNIPAWRVSFEQPIHFSAYASGYNHQDATYIETGVYGRWLCVGDTWNGNEAYKVSLNDIVGNNRNYPYCYPLQNGGSLLQQSTASSNDPTEWGVRPDGKYYVQPSPQSLGSKMFPIARNNWSLSSYWIEYTVAMAQLESAGRVKHELRDAYTLEAVINVLLGQIDTSLTFQATSDYSVFLYGTNPVNNAWGRLILSPKTNVLVAEYTQPARKAFTTLKEVFDMLRKTCDLYWFIDDSNRLRFEHISWFRNGGAYSDQRQVGINLLTMINIRNNTDYARGQSEYLYDKPDMCERYQYGWQDDTTTTFMGEAIEVLSKYVSQGRVEDITVAGFNSDVDYMMLNPTGCSQDGFALICGRWHNSRWETEILTDGAWSVQNWQLAFKYLQTSFLLYDMPAWSLKVNGAPRTADGIQYKKKQSVTIPAEDTDIDLTKLVRTSVGDGVIEKVSLRLTARSAKISLVFPTCARPNNS